MKRKPLLQSPRSPPFVQFRITTSECSLCHRIGVQTCPTCTFSSPSFAVLRRVCVTEVFCARIFLIDYIYLLYQYVYKIPHCIKNVKNRSFLDFKPIYCFLVAKLLVGQESWSRKTWKARQRRRRRRRRRKKLAPAAPTCLRHAAFSTSV